MLRRVGLSLRDAGEKVGHGGLSLAGKLVALVGVIVGSGSVTVRCGLETTQKPGQTIVHDVQPDAAVATVEVSVVGQVRDAAATVAVVEIRDQAGGRVGERQVNADEKPSAPGEVSRTFEPIVLPEGRYTFVVWTSDCGGGCGGLSGEEVQAAIESHAPKDACRHTVDVLLGSTMLLFGLSESDRCEPVAFTFTQ